MTRIPVVIAPSAAFTDYLRSQSELARRMPLDFLFSWLVNFRAWFLSRCAARAVRGVVRGPPGGSPAGEQDAPGDCFPVEVLSGLVVHHRPIGTDDAARSPGKAGGVTE